MCELFAMSVSAGNVPADAAQPFWQRATLPGAPRDGWGVAQHQGILIAHMRKATQGSLAVANTQPFVRHRWGATHAFAHNGDLDAQALHAAFPLLRERPSGDTDSEYAFSLLLDWLEPLWSGGTLPGVQRRFDVVSRLAAMLRPLGPFNFLYSDGDALFAHAHRRTQRDSRIAPPGMHMRRDRRAAASIPAVSFSSVPLSGAGWQPMEEGELVAVRRGKLVCEAHGVPAFAAVSAS